MYARYTRTRYAHGRAHAVWLRTHYSLHVYPDYGCCCGLVVAVTHAPPLDVWFTLVGCRTGLRAHTTRYGLRYAPRCVCPRAHIPHARFTRWFAQFTRWLHTHSVCYILLRTRLRTGLPRGLPLHAFYTVTVVITTLHCGYLPRITFTLHLGSAFTHAHPIRAAFGCGHTTVGRHHHTLVGFVAADHVWLRTAGPWTRTVAGLRLVTHALRWLVGCTFSARHVAVATRARVDLRCVTHVHGLIYVTFTRARYVYALTYVCCLRCLRCELQLRHS